MNKKMLKSSLTLAGTAIGAGFLGIPYSIAAVGLSLGLLLMVLVSLAVTLLQLMLAEVSLRTKTDHQIPGYVGIYQGGFWKKIAFSSGLLSAYGTFLAYIIGATSVLSTLFGGSTLFWAVGFVLFISIFVYRGIKAVMNMETLLVGGMFFVISFIVVTSLPYFSVSNFPATSWQNIFAPYGVLLFAFSASSVVPQLRRQLLGDENLFPKVIYLGNLLVFLFYATFAVVVLGVSGQNVSEIATLGLGEVVGGNLQLVGNLLALLAMSTSFLSIGLSVRRSFQYDFKVRRLPAMFYTLLPPLVLFALSHLSFVSVLSLVGGVLLGVEGILIVLSFWKAQKNGGRKPEWKLGPLQMTSVVLLVILLLGAILSVR